MASNGLITMSMRIQRIPSAKIGALGHSSKLNAGSDFVTIRRDKGRACTGRFLHDHADSTGKRSTLDLDEILQGVRLSSFPAPYKTLLTEISYQRRL